MIKIIGWIVLVIAVLAYIRALLSANGRDDENGGNKMDKDCNRRL